MTRQVESGRYDTRDDFTVVIQPFNVKSKLPMVRSGFGMMADPTFMSADCFHLSQRGHSLSKSLAAQEVHSAE